MSTRKRRSYTDEFKRDAVSLINSEGYSVREASERLGINENVLRRWKSKLEEEPNSLLKNAVLNSAELEEENRRQRKEIRRLRMERDILKKATACVL